MQVRRVRTLKVQGIINANKHQKYNKEINERCKIINHSYTSHFKSLKNASVVSNAGFVFFFFCNGRFLHNPHESLKKAFYCLYLHLYFNELIKRL